MVIQLFVVVVIATVVASCVTRDTTNASHHPPDYLCTARESVFVDFDDFAREPRRFNGQCVRGVGFHNGLGLYRNSVSLSEPNVNRPRAILLEIDDPDTGERFAQTREHGEFIGLAYF